MFPEIPRGLIIMIVCLSTFAWFCIGEQKNFWEKISTVLFLGVIFVLYRLVNGDTLGNMLSIVKDFIFSN